jgi:hypothetical protein
LATTTPQVIDNNKISDVVKGVFHYSSLISPISYLSLQLMEKIGNRKIQLFATLIIFVFVFLVFSCDLYK